VGDEIRLAVPASPGHVRLARLTVASLAGELGFSFDAVEDLRIAVDELCYLLGADGRPGSITLRFDIDGAALVITGEGPAGAQRREFAELSEQILAATVDEYSVTRVDGHVSCRLVRRREPI
jgi:anti-sigma regulatory factor (Ser/Thr protein kinase)